MAEETLESIAKLFGFGEDKPLQPPRFAKVTAVSGDTVTVQLGTQTVAAVRCCVCSVGDVVLLETLPSGQLAAIGTRGDTGGAGTYLPLAGGTLTGPVTTTSYITSRLSNASYGFRHVADGTSSVSAGLRVQRTDTGADMFVGIGSAGVNHGVYSNTLGKWLVYGTASNVYLKGNADTATSASEAAKLSTARSLQTDLESTTAASFDGTAAATIGVTGTLPIANGGTGKTTATAAALAFNNGLMGMAGAGTIGWYHVADISCTSGFRVLRFSVMNGDYTACGGFLDVVLQYASGSITIRKFRWQSSNGVDPTHYLLRINGTVAELYVYVSTTSRSIFVQLMQAATQYNYISNAAVFSFYRPTAPEATAPTGTTSTL